MKRILVLLFTLAFLFTVGVGLSGVAIASNDIAYPENGYLFSKITREAYFAMPDNTKYQEHGCVGQALWIQEYALERGILVNIEVMDYQQYYRHFKRKLALGYEHFVISAIAPSWDGKIKYIWYADGPRQAKGYRVD